ncbi:MAG: hypothetical protein A2X78_03595 [Gammaproteobacteria bacterium GWE2_37_16]|nr:MAG: hypothetical protein A2X78_03595 [Gammaproteobacteria bacterium GWE2_37_16]
MNKTTFLFEISWEVCNKVGGIYTVLRSKAKQAIKNFGANYILIGPWLENNHHFIEENNPTNDKIKTLLTSKGLLCCIGYWDIGYGEKTEQPTVILVAYKDRYNINTLLYDLWSDYGVDSLASNFEYYEPILFSTASGEVVKALCEEFSDTNTQLIAHFHEWLCGAGILYLKKHCRDVITIFTTHATVLGRTLASYNKLVYNLDTNFDPNAEAKNYGVFAKHSLETAAAREADCFTTVSDLTADETNIILDKYPDKIASNGLDIEKTQQFKYYEKTATTRTHLLEITSKVIGKNLPENTHFWITSGRYEFHNKGYDLLLNTITELEKSLKPEDSEIVLFFLIAANHHTKQDSLLNIDRATLPEQNAAFGIATHKIANPNSDPLLRACSNLNLKDPNRKIHVVYSDAYLDGTDGVFDLPYEQVLAACDLSLFLSFYEPWGYTPLESIAQTTPTITTDLAGFGSWVSSLKNSDYRDAVFVLERKNKSQETVIKTLCDQLIVILKRDSTYNDAIRQKSASLAKLADWSFFYKNYLDAYEQAIEFNEIYYARFDTTESGEKYYTLIQEAETTTPRFHLMQNEGILPNEISGLRDIAYNFWWSWHESVKLLFQAIDSVIWDKVQHNPVRFLNVVSHAALLKKVHDENYMHEYHNKLQYFNSYCGDKKINETCNTNAICNERPIAYFCMEYGLDECLPIYSGGLGILAGDYLKTMSDLNVPMIAIGLFYKQGYFHQSINFQNEQIAFYETQDPNQVPMRLVNDNDGKAISVSVEVLDRTVHVRVWEIKVGRVSLYLLDTDVPENSPSDREITSRLYAGPKETRLIQEIILGIGGTRFITEKLNLNPILYHLNEGHSAFLLLERIRKLAKTGLSFDEACTAVRSSSVFTTHTPIPAGNETFSEDLIHKYFFKYQEFIGASQNTIDKITSAINKIMTLARDFEEKIPVFSMTALALNLSESANAVSKIHGNISRAMWQKIWPGVLESETPIDEITNGIHLSTWIGDAMKNLYDEYLGFDWKIKQADPKVWEKIATIPNKKLFDAHQLEKEKLLDAIRTRVVQEYPARNESKLLISQSLNCLDSNVLMIGLARRFVSYKRNALILRDKERLARILTNTQRPIVLVIAGKAHPADILAKELVSDFIITARDKNLQGHIIFLEEYDMALAKLLTHGIDIWLNTPLIGKEACGTSGMKVGLNGGLNFSTQDGWWDEAYEPKIGWIIDSFPSLADEAQRDDMENMYMLDTLEYSIAPLYYTNNQGTPKEEWLEKMKASIAKIAYQYSSQRMANEYLEKLYYPLAKYSIDLESDAYAKLKKIVAWGKDVTERFYTVKIKTILVNGVKDGKIMTEGMVTIKVLLFSGKVKASELKIELILAKNENQKMQEPVTIIPMQLVDKRESGILTYIAQYNVEDTGFYSYGVRVLPYNSALQKQSDLRLVVWG